MAYRPTDEESYPLLRDLSAPQSVRVGELKGQLLQPQNAPTLSI